MHLINLATGIIGGLTGAIWIAGGGYGVALAFLAYALFGAMALTLSLALSAFRPLPYRLAKAPADLGVANTNLYETGRPGRRPQPRAR